MDEYPVMVSYPAGLQQDYIVHLSLDRFGIGNFYLTVRFRPSELYGEERSERDPAKQIGEKLGPLSQSDPYSVNRRPRTLKKRKNCIDIKRLWDLLCTQ